MQQGARPLGSRTRHGRRPKQVFRLCSRCQPWLASSAVVHRVCGVLGRGNAVIHALFSFFRVLSSCTLSSPPPPTCQLSPPCSGLHVLSRLMALPLYGVYLIQLQLSVRLLSSSIFPLMCCPLLQDPPLVPSSSFPYSQAMLILHSLLKNLHSLVLKHGTCS